VQLGRVTMEDIRCWRGANREPKCSIPQRIKHHSLTGFSWGCWGAGSSDLALNILDRYLPVQPGTEYVPCWDGSIVSIEAWDLHSSFMADVIAPLPEEGGTISDRQIRDWLRERGVMPRPPRPVAIDRDYWRHHAQGARQVIAVRITEIRRSVALIEVPVTASSDEIESFLQEAHYGGATPSLDELLGTRPAMIESRLIDRTWDWSLWQTRRVPDPAQAVDPAVAPVESTAVPASHAPEE